MSKSIIYKDENYTISAKYEGCMFPEIDLIGLGIEKLESGDSLFLGMFKEDDQRKILQGFINRLETIKNSV